MLSGLELVYLICFELENRFKSVYRCSGMLGALLSPMLIKPKSVLANKSWNENNKSGRLFSISTLFQLKLVCIVMELFSISVLHELSRL